jgi:gas vesicle protein
MDQGIAGLIGAVVGGLIGVTGTLGAARVTGRDQRRGQHEQWRRQVRRDAYSQFISRCRGAIRAANAAHDALKDGRAGASDLVYRFNEAVSDLEEALSLVMLEGPESVAAEADSVHGHVHVWAWALGAIESGCDDPQEKWRRAIDSTHFSEDGLLEFTEVSRAVLDESDLSRTAP